ncbi:MAG TPA: deoxyribonuclease IV [Thermodesulfovibrionales bacterium]|nr:deoxyribonuclease IV [Thermodesulfovibrionales bacterium]
MHTSIAGGIHLSMERAGELGCNTAQIFSHNPRAWSVGIIPEESVSLFRELRRLHDIDPVFIHTSYLINLAAPDIGIREKSKELLIRELDLADLLAADHVVLHTGSASGDAEDAARQRAIAALREVAKVKTWRAKLLLENTAGERGDISSTMRDLSEIIEKTDSPVIGGICIDTCHAFQAGYELTSAEGLSRIAGEIKTYIGSENLKLIHLNDSRRVFHSRVDRHEHIGEGAIGKKWIEKFINHPIFRNTPLVLETPKKSDEDDMRNLDIVRRLMRQSVFEPARKR